MIAVAAITLPVGFVVAQLSLPAESLLNATAVRKLKVVSSFSQGLSQLVFGYNDFVADVASLSGGLLEFEFSDAASIGESPLVVVQGARNGGFDIALTDPPYGASAYAAGLSYNGSKVDAMDKSYGLTGNALPFGMDPFSFLVFREFQAKALIDKESEAYGLHQIVLGSSGGQMSGYLNADANITLFKADPVAWYAGKHGRVGGLSALVLESFDATTQSSSGGELAAGLKTGGAFAFGEFIGPNIDPVIGLPEGVGAILPTTWGETAPLVSLEINLKTWNSFSAQEKSWLESAAFKNYYRNLKKQYDGSYTKWSDKYVTSGIEIIDLATLTSPSNANKPFLTVAREKWNAVNAGETNAFWVSFMALYSSYQTTLADWVNKYPENPSSVS